MKKIMLFALALCLLAGCGGSKPAEYDVKQTPAALMDAGVFSEPLELLDTDIACILYGIDESLLADCAVYASTGATAEEVGVFKFKTEKDAEDAVQLLNQRRDDLKVAYAGYGPQEVPKLDAAYIGWRNSTVIYVVAADAKGVSDFFNGK